MSQAVHVLKKTFKYLLFLLLFLIIAIVSIVAYVLHTESGTRFAIEQGIKWAQLDIKYDQLSGNLSDGLVIKNFNYNSQSIDINVNKISYQSTWNWFDRHLTLSEAQIDETTITLKPTTEVAPANQEPFTGFSLPLSIDIEKLTVNELTLNNNDLQANKSDVTADAVNTKAAFNKINLSELKAAFGSESVVIDSLIIKAPEFELDSSGDIEYGNGLAYDLKTKWLVDINQQKISGSGPIKGNLQQINLNQNFSFLSDQINGTYQLAGSVSELSEVPRFDLRLQSKQTEVKVDQQTISMAELSAELTGLLEDYQLDLSVKILGDEIKGELGGKQTAQSNLQANNNRETESHPKLSYPNSEIKLLVTGNTQKLTTQRAQLMTPEGHVNFKADVQWQPQLAVISEVSLVDFNPQQILPDWSGLIEGAINLEIMSQPQGLSITTRNNQLSGELKGQSFELTGSADYALETFTAEQLSLQLGENYLTVDGEVKPQNVALTVAINWLDLSVLSPTLSGEVKGIVDMSGDYQRPDLKAEIVAQQLNFDDQSIAKVTVNSAGKWAEKIQSTIKITQANLAGRNIENIDISQTGWLNEHQVDLTLNAQDISTQLSLAGQYKPAVLAPNKVLWQGQLLEHKITVEDDKTIQLQQPIKVVLGDLISIEKGCWEGVEAGKICIELNDIDKNKQNYQGSLTVDSFSLVPLQILLPQAVELKGQLQGAADFKMENKAVNVESNISLQNGELLIFKPSTAAAEPTYQSAIKTFKIDAITSNKDINITINTRLSDDSFIDLTAQLNNIDDESWQIDSAFSGQFNNTALIQQLTEEISEIEGEITLGGSIKGELTKPRISLDLNQPKGFLTLSRLGTVIEGLELSVITEDLSQPTYKIRFSGQNLAKINQGSIESTGDFTLLDDASWLYEGEIAGNNFMLLNLAEAKFNISPDLSIQATGESTTIKGVLAIDSGRVTVKQLPPSTVKNSSDVVIHRPNTEKPNTYPIELAITANIKEAIELDVIGLKSGLTGSIQLTQNNNQALMGRGTLNLADGTYEIYGQELNIKNGELIFTGPLDNPRINVKASRKSISGDVTAGVELGGTVNNLRSNLYSNPSLSDIEKLSYIMTGRGIDNSGGLDGEQLQQAAIVMGLNQSSPVFKQIQSQFGIDVLTVREAASTADTVVEAGKQLSEKLYVSYNQGLFNRLGFWLLKYRINDFLNLETTQGEDQSVELVYTRKAEIKDKSKQEDNR